VGEYILLVKAINNFYIPTSGGGGYRVMSSGGYRWQIFYFVECIFHEVC